mmetsp:Transcript_37220/g.92551  ORF Transcript_37220/g.92551 Transcript_37220/m.92551 type:complete len:325 (+) Transcript_37220:390-1364(+)
MAAANSAFGPGDEPNPPPPPPLPPPPHPLPSGVETNSRCNVSSAAFTARPASAASVNNPCCAPPAFLPPLRPPSPDSSGTVSRAILLTTSSNVPGLASTITGPVPTSPLPFPTPAAPPPMVAPAVFRPSPAVCLPPSTMFTSWTTVKAPEHSSPAAGGYTRTSAVRLTATSWKYRSASSRVLAGTPSPFTSAAALASRFAISSKLRAIAAPPSPTSRAYLGCNVMVSFIIADTASWLSGAKSTQRSSNFGRSISHRSYNSSPCCARVSGDPGSFTVVRRRKTTNTRRARASSTGDEPKPLPLPSPSPEVSFEGCGSCGRRRNWR